MTTGKSSLAPINDRLLTEAKRKLLYSDMTVNEIGSALGYADPAFINRFFSRDVGLSPGRFRKACCRARAARLPIEARAGKPRCVISRV